MYFLFINPLRNIPLFLVLATCNFSATSKTRVENIFANYFFFFFSLRIFVFAICKEFFCFLRIAKLFNASASSNVPAFLRFDADFFSVSS
jgi:hypothetical protein